MQKGKITLKMGTRFAAMMNDIMDGYDVFFSFIKHYGRDFICMGADDLNKLDELNRRYLNACSSYNQLLDGIENNKHSKIQYRWTRKHPLKAKRILGLIQKKIRYENRN